MNPVTVVADDLVRMVLEGETLVDLPSDDPALDAEFQRAHAKAKALLRGLIGDDAMATLGLLEVDR